MVGRTTPPQSDSGEISRVLVLNLLWQSKRCSRTAEEIFVLDNAFALIDGGTTPPQSDSGEISRVLVLNLLWQSKRCSRTAQDISVLTTPSLLSMGDFLWRRRKSSLNP